MNNRRSICILFAVFPFFVVFLFFRYQQTMQPVYKNNLLQLFKEESMHQNKSMQQKESMIQQLKKQKDDVLQQLNHEKDDVLQQLKKEKDNVLQQMVKMKESLHQVKKEKEPSAVPKKIEVKDMCTLLDKDLQDDPWWKYVCLIERNIDKPVGYKCKDSRNMGNWPVCFDENYSPIRPNKPCLVYSFGIAWDFSFDKEMAKRGCEVYSFDPSMGLEDHTYTKNVYFKNLGLSHVDNDTFSPRFDIYVKKPQKWKIRTLRSVMKMLKHEKRVIDVLKFDIEIAEWEVMANIIQDGMLPQIRQLLTEWHIFPKAPKREKLKSYYEMLRDLPSHGLETFYRRGHTRRHLNLNGFNSQAESCYVNVKFTEPQ